MKLLTNKIFLIVSLIIVSVILLSLPVMFETPSTETAAGQSPWVAFLGSFHPLFLHLPIGFLLLILSMEAYGLVTKKEQMPMQVPLILNALAAIAAAVFGFVLYRTGAWEGEVIEDHLWQGLFFAVVAIWLPLIYAFTREKLQAVYYVMLVFGVGIMFSAAHHGGELTHGDPFDKAPWNDEVKAKAERDAKLAAGESVVNEDTLVYEDVIVPILESKCYACHGEKKSKNGLRLDSIAHMISGGDDDTALRKGDAAHSPLITSIKHTPIDDDEHMPPKNKPQITDDELTVLEWWVNQKAPEGKKISDMQVPANVLKAMGSKSEPVKVAKSNTNLGLYFFA